jgi:hypothetical protein
MSYAGVVRVAMSHRDGVDWTTVEVRTHPNQGNNYVATLYDGSLKAFIERNGR